MTRPLVLITGASSGIGMAFAREFARHGWDCALSARRRDRLEALAEELKAQSGVNSVIAPADLSDPAAPRAIIEEIGKAGRQIDGLVNNGGYGQPGGFIETDWETQARFLQTMMTSYAELLHRLLPGMVERGYGRVVNVASVSALLPSAKTHTAYSGAMYPGMKGALIKLSEALRLEVEGSGVHVSAIAPGYTLSEFHDVNGARGVVSGLPRYWMLSAEQVATAGYWAVESNKPLEVPGSWYKFLCAVTRILPDPVNQAIMRRQAEKMAQGAKPAAGQPAR